MEEMKEELQKVEKELKNQLNQVRSEMKENFDLVNQRLDGIIDRFDKISNNRAEMRELLSKIEKNTSSYRANQIYKS
ncbi:hypothetical protein [Priestia megaterium]|uniref:hypothetical protein n=1 Tax=Priestia megaterium TaxID=1404 RepID=UPI002E1F47BE|nr:hypothetical protein [Priestia megaterium]